MEHSAAPSNQDESLPASEEPSEEAPLGHEHEEPMVQRIKELMEHRKEATERLSEKTESRGQSPDLKNRELKKNWELKKTGLNDYHAHRTSLCNGSKVRKRMKKTRSSRGCKEHVDRISALSDDLLVKIPTCLPTRVAASTTVLSKRWECLWM
uniref:Uncharacterized protein n=1 Tax=Brassica oleracea var. oleracea TaxID=109376 RepID=A0A0D3E214_BRAOL